MDVLDKPHSVVMVWILNQKISRHAQSLITKAAFQKVLPVIKRSTTPRNDYLSCPPQDCSEWSETVTSSMTVNHVWQMFYTNALIFMATKKLHPATVCYRTIIIS
jgi:hypothetical protein